MIGSADDNFNGFDSKPIIKSPMPGCKKKNCLRGGYGE